MFIFIYIQNCKLYLIHSPLYTHFLIFIIKYKDKIKVIYLKELRINFKIILQNDIGTFYYYIFYEFNYFYITNSKKWQARNELALDCYSIRQICQATLQGSALRSTIRFIHPSVVVSPPSSCKLSSQYSLSLASPTILPARIPFIRCLRSKDLMWLHLELLAF